MTLYRGFMELLEQYQGSNWATLFTMEFDENEACVGLWHRDVVHMLEILNEPKATKANKVQALRLLAEVIPGKQQEAVQHNVFEILRPFLMQKPNGMVLNTLVVLNRLVITKDLARQIVGDVPRLAELVDPNMDVSIRQEAVTLLRIIADFLGPEPEFMSGAVPTQLIEATSSQYSGDEFLNEAFRLLSRLTSKHPIKGPIIESKPLLTTLIRSISKESLRTNALLLASSIAMDSANKSKIALIEADIFGSLGIYLQDRDPETRLSVLSLIALLVVPKEGKQVIATSQELPEVIVSISKLDENEKCRKAAERVVALASELPFARAVFGASSK